MNAIELIAALKGADEETAMELVDRLQCGEIDCSVLPTGKDNAVQQAQIWAQEARTQKGIVEEIGKLVGCANDWEMVDAIKAALSASGGEAEPVAWVVFADNGNIRIWGREKPEAFPEAVPLYLSPTVKDFLTVQSEPIGYADPDSLNDYRAGDRLHMPVYRPDASADWQDGIPVYLHPAPPSVAVPEGWKLVPIEPTDDMRKKAGLSRGADFYTISKVWHAMLAAAPSPDHIAEGGEVVWAVIDRDGQVAYSVTPTDEYREEWAVSSCHEHINEAVSDGIEGAAEWVVRPLTIGTATPSVPENEVKALALEDAAIKVVAEAVEIEVRLDDGQDIVEGTAGIEEHIAEWLHKEAARLRTTGDEGDE